MKILEAELRYSRLSLVDVGRVFWWQGRLFRAFPEGAADAVLKLFDSGLVAKLVADGLLVESWISSYQVDGYALVVEHKVVPVPAYPREWSFSMLKDAGRLVLALNDRARQYGYQTKDCNGYNVLFNEGKPVFVDLTSFVEVSSKEDVLLPYEEFLLSYYHPLQLWRSAGQYLGSKCAPRAVGLLLAPQAYLRYRWPIFRLFSDTALVRGFKTLNSVRTLQHNDFDKLRQRLSPWLLHLLMATRRIGLFRRPARIDILDRKLASMENLTGASTWANYHDAFNRGHELTSTPRFDAVIEIIAALGSRSVLEFAGNQGVLSRLIRQRLPGTRVICTDTDGSAIDKGYCLSRDAKEGVEWAIFNPFAYEGSPVEVRPEERFKADAVVVLALTHHLTLSQNFRLEYILDVIGHYAVKHVLVEFMPLGLYNGTSAPNVPDGYNDAWFSDAFCKKFKLIERIELEPNRILFVGAVRTQQP